MLLYRKSVLNMLFYYDVQFIQDVSVMKYGDQLLGHF